tara:strand:- start:3800 stop:4333 length:534 start_codon:yes stop_codon:yes gene_type:complete
MRRSASEVIRNLEMRIARLENRNAGIDAFDVAKVRRTILKALLNSKPKQEKWEEDYEGDNYGFEYSAGVALEYRVPLRLICRLVSKALGKEVSRDDLKPFIDDLPYSLPEKMDRRWSRLDDVEEFLNIDLELDGIDHWGVLDSARVETEVEVDDTHRDSDDYLIVYYYIRAEKSEGP